MSNKSKNGIIAGLIAMCVFSYFLIFMMTNSAEHYIKSHSNEVGVSIVDYIKTHSKNDTVWFNFRHGNCKFEQSSESISPEIYVEKTRFNTELHVIFKCKTFMGDSIEALYGTKLFLYWQGCSYNHIGPCYNRHDYDTYEYLIKIKYYDVLDLDVFPWYINRFTAEG